MTQTMDLREFLQSAELDHYYNEIHDNLKVASVAHIKYVEDQDLTGIGMTKPEIRRLRQYYKKVYPHGALGKLKKILATGLGDAGGTSPPAGEKQNPLSKSVNKHLISEDALSILKTLGTGEFGIVQQGTWTTDHGDRIPVAVKCLGKDKLKTQMAEFLQEAANMCSVDHPHIVQLHGVVLGSDCFMLVTELAPMGTLLDCLRDKILGPTFGVSLLCDLALQIADGMAYLENRRLIHRDLAARNILMFAKDKAKVSDFGLSRALGVEKDYYQSQPNTNLVLPIAWCAPECINYLKFTSASDVWSFGVTLWEMFSRGAQPWKGMTGLEIMQAVDEPNLQRLDQPELCPDEWYQLLLKCWSAEPNDRPKFSELFLVTLNEIKPSRVVALKDVSSEDSACLSYKSTEIIVVLSKKPHSKDGSQSSVDMWKGVLEHGSHVGFFDPSNSMPFLEMRSTAQIFKKKQTEAARSSLRTSRKLNADMIGLPQNDLRHIGHVGYDGAVFGDVSFIGDNYSKLPIKLVNTQNTANMQPQTNGTTSIDLAAEPLCKKMTSSAYELFPKERDSDFDDFQLPDMSISLDFGSSMMDEVMKTIGTDVSAPDAEPVQRTDLSALQHPAVENLHEDAAGSDGESDSETHSDNEEMEDTDPESSVSEEPEAYNAVNSRLETSNSPLVERTMPDISITATAESDFTPKSPPPSASVGLKSDGNAGSTKRLVSIDLESSSGVRALRVESNHRLHGSSADDDTDEEKGLDHNGFSVEATTAYDELVGHKRNSSGSSSGGHSAGRGSATWKNSSELSSGSATELSKGLTSSGSTQRLTNQNIRAPQGIPGRDGPVRKPFINPSTASVGGSLSPGKADAELDTNPLRRLRDSQSGFTKPVKQSSASSLSAIPQASEALPAASNNLNVNLSFFDKLKEQEQQRML